MVFYMEKETRFPNQTSSRGTNFVVVPGCVLTTQFYIKNLIQLIEQQLTIMVVLPLFVLF